MRDPTHWARNTMNSTLLLPIPLWREFTCQRMVGDSMGTVLHHTQQHEPRVHPQPLRPWAASLGFPPGLHVGSSSSTRPGLGVPVTAQSLLSHRWWTRACPRLSCLTDGPDPCPAMPPAVLISPLRWQRALQSGRAPRRAWLWGGGAAPQPRGDSAGLAAAQSPTGRGRGSSLAETLLLPPPDSVGPDLFTDPLFPFHLLMSRACFMDPSCFWMKCSPGADKTLWQHGSREEEEAMQVHVQPRHRGLLHRLQPMAAAGEGKARQGRAVPSSGRPRARAWLPGAASGLLRNASGEKQLLL